MKLASQDWWQRRRADVAAIGAIAIFFLTFFQNVFFGHRFIIAGDALYYSYPLRTVAWRMIRSGELPLWTPYVLSGYPLLSMAQVAVGYPLTWGYLFISGPWAEQLYVLAPFLLTPIFTYAYLRELGRSRLAALFGGLAFAYGGMMGSFISNSGVLTNSLMWTPLVLLFIDRARNRSWKSCLLWATAAYSMSVLAGHGQSYVYVGIVAISYGVFVTLMRGPDERRINIKPALVAIGAILLSGGVAAFQLLESLQAARFSIRSGLSYQGFGEGAFSPREALLSIGAPLYHYVDTSAYVTPLALILSAIALVSGWRRRARHDSRIWFWLIAAVVAFLLMLGPHTPLYRIAYLVPVLNSFRVASRHTFEWTFALSVLAAFGWDTVADYFRNTISRNSDTKLHLLGVAILIVVTVVTGVVWWFAANTPPRPNPSIYTGLPESIYWLWKLVFTALILLLAWSAFSLKTDRFRIAALVIVSMLACFVETSATVACWWAGRLSLSDRRLQVVSPTTRYLQQFPAEQNRVYSRAELFAEEFRAYPRLEAPNLPAIYGLHNVAGMEPLIFERYSRALGGVGPDSVTPRAGFPANNDLLTARSHVLDILNTTYVVTFSTLKPYEEPFVERDGIETSVMDLNLGLSPRATVRLTGSAGAVDNLSIISRLANSVETPQGATVARIRLYTTDGKILEQELRAGIDTAEWAHERSDVRASIKHGLAQVFDSRPGDAGNTFSSYRYWSRHSWPELKQIKWVEIENVSSSATLSVSSATLYNSQTGVSTQLGSDSRSEFWEAVFDQGNVQVQHNRRAQPRAWLVTEAEAVDAAEALRRIRGETGQFNPRRTALLEVAANELPSLPGGNLPAGSSARMLTYSPNFIRMETEAPTPAILVVSEIYYPGWDATIDGQAAQILPANYLLRGLPVPAGKHVVEMRYRAPAARSGALISGVTLCLLLGLSVTAYLKRKAS